MYKQMCVYVTFICYIYIYICIPIFGYMHDTQVYQGSFACICSSKKCCLENDFAL